MRDEGEGEKLINMMEITRGQQQPASVAAAAIVAVAGAGARARAGAGVGALSITVPWHRSSNTRYSWFRRSD